LQPVAVAADQRHLACLPDSWLQRVAQFALAAEQTLGQPQDVEWAIAGQHLWLLQSRPITTLITEMRQQTQFPIAWANEEERNRIWWLNRLNNRPWATLLQREPRSIGLLQHSRGASGQSWKTVRASTREHRRQLELPAMLLFSIVS